MDRFLHLSALFIILTLYSPAYGAKSYPPRFPIYENGRAGFIDKSGTVVIKPRFDWTDEYFRGPYCRASLKKKMGIIDRSGKWVIQPRFFSIGYPSGGYVTVSDKKYKSAFVSMKGVRLTPYIYDRIEPFLRGECLVVKGDKYGILNSSLKPLIPIVYDHLTPFRDGLAVAKRRGSFLLINRKNQQVKLLPYDRVQPMEQHFKVVLNKKEGLLDHKGRLLVAPSYTSIWWFSEGLVSVEKAGKYGFINHAGKEIVKPKYSFANAFFKGLAPVRDEKTYTWGYINHKGRMVIPLRFAIAERFNEHGVAVVTVRPKNWKRRGSLRGLQGLIDTRGKFVAPPKYDAIWYFTEGTAVFEINSKFQTSYCMKCRHTIKMSSQFGYLDAKGREIIKPIYSHAKPFRNGLAQVMLQYKRAYINKRGKTIYIQK